MRRSKWLVAENFSIKKKGRRLVVEVGDAKGEVPLASVGLLAIMGEGKISSDALELICSEDAHLVLHNGERHAWLRCGYSRGVEYLVGQYKTREKLANTLTRSYLYSAESFLKSLGSEAAELPAYYARHAPTLQAVEKTEQIILLEIHERLTLPMSYNDLLKKYRLYRIFLEAEEISALLRAGLEPALIHGGAPLYKLAAYEFHPPLIWETLLRLARPASDTPQAWLLQAKAKLEGILRYREKPVEARRAIHSRAKGLAAAAINNKVELEPLTW